MIRKDAYYKKKECVLWKGRKRIMVKDKVQGDVPFVIAGVFVRMKNNTGNVCLMRPIRTVTSEAERLLGSAGYMAAERRDTIYYKQRYDIL